MASKAELDALFNIFIADEDKALASATQGDWYPSNWPELNRHMKKAPKVLASERLERFYFHLLRLMILPGAEAADTYPILEAAYRRQAALMRPVEGIGSQSDMHSFTGLLLFGFDDDTVAGANGGADDYLRYRAAYRQFAAYSHMPGMMSKPDRFAELATDHLVVGRICAVMRARDFIHDDWYRVRRSDEAYSWTWLPFWGAIFTLLLSPLDEARQTIAAFESRDCLPKRAEHMETLARYRAASLAFLAR